MANFVDLHAITAEMDDGEVLEPRGGDKGSPKASSPLLDLGNFVSVAEGSWLITYMMRPKLCTPNVFSVKRRMWKVNLI